MLQIAIVEDEADLAQQTKDNDVRYLNEHGLEGNIAVFNDAIKAYLDEHGELPLKEASITLPTGSQSHWWIRNQTLMLHQGRQSEDKVKLLNKIGIV